MAGGLPPEVGVIYKRGHVRHVNVMNDSAKLTRKRENHDRIK